VFKAFVNPEITTKFWFTKSGGRLEDGKQLQWDWEMYSMSIPVIVKLTHGRPKLTLRPKPMQGDYLSENLHDPVIVPENLGQPSACCIAGTIQSILCCTHAGI